MTCPRLAPGQTAPRPRALRWLTGGFLCELLCASLAALAPSQLEAGGFAVESTVPAANALSVPLDDAIVVRFTSPVDRASITERSYWALGRWSGPVRGSFRFSDGDREVALVPERPLSAAESVMVILSRDVTAADGSPLRDAGYSFGFWAAARPSEAVFERIDVFSTRGSSGRVRTYGGSGADLNNDGFLDLALTNEISADLRVFLNTADGSGSFGPLLEPPSSVNDHASPSEPADFDRDGNVDLCVVNSSAASVSVLLGNGDGTFAPQQELEVPSRPRGVAVLDVDGDGDLDIGVGSADTALLSVLVNDGEGVFALLRSFESGAPELWGLAAADMNGDGILDVVGGSREGRIVVHLGSGDGAFERAGTVDGVGDIWVLNLADLDGDGNTDIATGNHKSDNGTILFGDGVGGASIAKKYPSGTYPISTDLGDLDGDGDLDWVVSNFNGGWHVLLNDGRGVFTRAAEFPSSESGSCAIILDIDNDGRADLALVDELSDEVFIMRQPPGAPEFRRGDCNRSGSVDVSDAVFALLALFAGGRRTCDDACDANDDGGLDLSDAVSILNFLFRRDRLPPGIRLTCGADETADDLGCDAPRPCASP